MPLTLSHATGPTEPPLRDITIGALLAGAAETTRDRLALIAGMPEPAARRQWTYAELHAQSPRCAAARTFTRASWKNCCSAIRRWARWR